MPEVSIDGINQELVDRTRSALRTLRDQYKVPRDAADEVIRNLALARDSRKRAVCRGDSSRFGLIILGASIRSIERKLNAAKRMFRKKDSLYTSASFAYEALILEHNIVPACEVLENALEIYRDTKFLVNLAAAQTDHRESPSFAPAQEEVRFWRDLGQTVSELQSAFPNPNVSRSQAIPA